MLVLDESWKKNTRTKKPGQSGLRNQAIGQFLYGGAGTFRLLYGVYDPAENSVRAQPVRFHLQRPEMIMLFNVCVR
jgi:hypothetical protein